MKLIKEIKLKPNFSNDDLIFSICGKAKIKKEELRFFEIIKMGLDARRKPDIFYVLNVAVSVKDEKKLKGFEDITPDHSILEYERVSSSKRPVVVGFGPAGMFCALALARAGLCPIVLEQGKCVQERQIDVENFWNNRVLDEHSNVHFGEGGAGTFSDGKLNTTLNNDYCKKIINELITHGAPKEIYYKNKAHIGTDNLKTVVVNIREEIKKLGGNVIFSAKFIDFSLKNGQINSILYEDLKSGIKKQIECDALILAIGHSAVNVFKLLKESGVLMHKKPFAMGVRIEHPRKLIDLAQYGKIDNALPAADYKLAVHLKGERSVFTFCMCPGGRVVASSSTAGTIVTNGMSEFSRDGEYSNSALLVNVLPKDFEGDVLSGFEFQQKYERLAYEIAGGNYNAPAQKVGDFMEMELSTTKQSTYLLGLTMCKLDDCLPNFVSESLREALPLLGQKLKGFDNGDALLIGIESRSSCPVQMDRGEDYTCTNDGLYVIGEGAGYAGGIVSSAVDGIKCAEKIMGKLR